jgi:hypothetical protein
MTWSEGSNPDNALKTSRYASMAKRELTPGALEDTLKNLVLEFLDELHTSLPDEDDIFALRLYYDLKKSPHSIMMDLIKQMMPQEEFIKARDDTYFKTNGAIFADIGKRDDDDANAQSQKDKLRQEKMYHFTKLWDKGVITDKSKDSIWRYFDTFIAIVKKYQRLTRKQ